MADPTEIRAVACRLLGQQTGADRVYYMEFRPEEGDGLVMDDYRAEGLPSVAGRYPYEAFRSTYDRVSNGKTWVVPDVAHTKDIAAAEGAVYASQGVLSWTDVPLLKDERLRAVLCVVQSRPREWSHAEITLIEEVAERLWAAVERARAESALRDSEERLAAELANSVLLHDLADRLVTEENAQTIYDEILSAAITIMQSDAGTVQIYDPARKALELLVTRNFDRNMIDHFQYVDASSSTACGIALRTNERTLGDFGDNDTDEACVMHVAAGYRSAQVTPLVSRSGAPLGMINTHWHQSHHRPTERQLRYLGLLARQAADLIDRRQAERSVRESEEGLRMALEAGRMGTYRFEVATGVEQWDDNEYALLGLRRGEAPATRELFLSLVHPDDLHKVQFGADDERPPGTSLDTEFRIIRPDTGEVRHLTAHAVARFGPDGRPKELIGINQDVTEEREARAAKRATEERLQQFSEASSDILWIRDAEKLQWEYLSPAFHRIYGISREDALRGDNYKSWGELIVPEDRERALRSMEAVRRGERAVFEYRVRRPEDGGIRWLRDTDFPMRDAAGNVVSIGGIGTDVTPIKDAEEHQRVLLHELQHRVRNTLAVIRSIIRRTARTTENKDDFINHIEGRISAFARVQAAVTRDPTMGVDLGLMVAEELRVIGAQEGGGVTISGPQVALGPKAAESLGLAVHELATNAMKYGALTIPRGHIAVSWSLEGRTPDQALVFDWLERGFSDLTAPTRRGFGTDILERTLGYELRAQTKLEFRPTGFHCRIEVPAQELSASNIAPIH